MESLNNAKVLKIMTPRAIQVNANHGFKVIEKEVSFRLLLSTWILDAS